MNRNLSYVMLCLGEVLIIAGFFLFLQDIQTSGLFALNLIATMLIFAACYTRIFDFGKQAEMRSGYAGMGLRWLAITIFAAASGTLVVCSILFDLSFTLCLWLQLTLVLFTGMLLLGAKIAGDNAARTLARMEGEMDTLKELKAQLTMMEIAADRTAIAAQARETVSRLQDEVNFLTVSLTPTAKALERELTAKFRIMTELLQSAQLTAEAFAEQAEACISLLRVRRQQHYR